MNVHMRKIQRVSDIKRTLEAAASFKNKLACDFYRSLQLYCTSVQRCFVLKLPDDESL